MKLKERKFLQLLLAWLIFLAPFLVTRLPLLVHYPVVIYNDDDAGYFQILDQMDKGFAPHLAIRPLGYPLFLKLVYAFSNRNTSVIFAQHLLTLFSCLFFIYALWRIYRERPFIPLLSALAVALFACTGMHTCLDSTIMTDSLFTSLVQLTLGAALLGLFRRSGLLLALSSACLALSIVVRPAGIFLLAFYLLILAYALVNRLPRRLAILFATPTALLLAAYGLFNLFTIRSFTLSTFSEHALVSFTSTFMEKGPSYDPVMNGAVENCRRAMGLPDVRILATTWDYGKLYELQNKYYEANRIRVARTFFDSEPPDAYDLYLKWRPRWRRMAMDAIKAHPRIAAKYAYSNLVINLFSNISFDPEVYEWLRIAFAQAPTLHERWQGFADPRSFFNRRFNTRAYAQTLDASFVPFMLKEYDRPIPFAKAPLGKDGSVTLRPTRLQKLHRAYQRLQILLFRHPLWIWIFLAASVFSLVWIVRTRMRHFGAFLFFALTFSALAYIIFLSVSAAFALLRYTYVVEYVIYLSPFLWLVAILPDPGGEPTPAAACR